MHVQLIKGKHHMKQNIYEFILYEPENNKPVVFAYL